MIINVPVLENLQLSSQNFYTNGTNIMPLNSAGGSILQ